VRAGYRCACILRDLIDPYLLRRMKADVAQDLPQKSEQVLFCRLTPMQRAAYTSFLRSNDMEKILSGKLQMLFGVDVARKICDHPDLLLLSTLPTAVSTHNEARLKERDSNDSDVDYEAAAAGILPADYGDYQKSGKLSILRALLDMWQPQGHKVLVFSQTRQMLDIIERMLRQMPACVFRRMDGSTPVQNRAALVDEFNTNPDIFVFLLTTKVGGLGVNLTGADRVIL
ncbi:DNA repair protein rhp26, partial [Linderina pennispora]